MRKIKQGDKIIVIAGKDKGETGTVMKVINSKVIVENVNIAQKHVKPNPNNNTKGGIVSKEMPIQISNIALLNPTTNKADRVGFKILEDGKKVRVYKSNKEVVDI